MNSNLTQSLFIYISNLISRIYIYIEYIEYISYLEFIYISNLTQSLFIFISSICAIYNYKNANFVIKKTTKNSKDERKC